MVYRSLADFEHDLAADLLNRGRFSRSAPPSAARAQIVIVIDDGFVSGDERVVAMRYGRRHSSSTSRHRLTDWRRVAGYNWWSGTERSARTAFGVEEFADMDSLSVAEAEAFARSMAGTDSRPPLNS